MKKLLFFALISSLAFLTACNKDDDSDHHEDTPEYSITINNPSVEDKHVNDTLPIEVVFESGTGETIHHVNVKIYNKTATETEIYNGPSDAHVMESSGKYTFTHSLELTEANGVMAHTDWIVETKVWGHEAGAHEVTKTLEFHVHPE